MLSWAVTFPVKNHLFHQELFKRNTYMVCMVSEVRLAFWGSSSFLSSVWFFTTSLLSHSQFLLLQGTFGITVKWQFKENRELVLCFFFLNYNFFVSCLLHRWWMLLTQLGMGWKISLQRGSCSLDAAGIDSDGERKQRWAKPQIL